MRSVHGVGAVLLSLVLSWPLAATGAAPEIRDLAPMVVSGEQPGPGLWKVVAADGHVLWVLGFVRPLPTGMDWQSGQVEAIIAEAGLVLEPPGLDVRADVGFFRGLTLLPAARRMHRSPDGAELEDLLSPAAYRRWREQKQKYLGWEWGIERWRPAFAADKLYNAALEHHGLGGGAVYPVVRAATERAGLEITPVQFSIQLEEPRQLMNEFSRVAIDDVACMERTLDQLEHGMPTLIERANAWATGDLAALRRLRGERSRCLEHVLQSDFARQHGFKDLEQKVRDRWLEAAVQALAEHPVALALLPMDEVLAGDGYLAELAQRGYRVEPPPGTEASAEIRAETAVPGPG